MMTRKELITFIYSQPKAVIECLLRMYTGEAVAEQSIDNIVMNLPYHQLRILENIFIVCTTDL